MLGGLGRFLARLARVTIRCRRPKATGFTACLYRWCLGALLGVVTGFGPPELRPLHVACRVVNSCQSPRSCAASTPPRWLNGARSETGFFKSLLGCSGVWGGFVGVSACNHSLQATQSRRVHSLPLSLVTRCFAWCCHWALGRLSLAVMRFKKCRWTKPFP